MPLLRVFKQKQEKKYMNHTVVSMQGTTSECQYLIWYVPVPAGITLTNQLTIPDSEVPKVPERYCSIVLDTPIEVFGKT